VTNKAAAAFAPLLAPLPMNAGLYSNSVYQRRRVSATHAKTFGDAAIWRIGENQTSGDQRITRWRNGAWRKGHRWRAAASTRGNAALAPLRMARRRVWRRHASGARRLRGAIISRGARSAARIIAATLAAMNAPAEGNNARQ